MAMLCSALRASVPPALRRTLAHAPSVTAQKIRCRTGGSSQPLAARQSMISEPLSELVTKYNTMAAREMTEIASLNRLVSPYDRMTSKNISFFPRHDKRKSPSKDSAAPFPPSVELQVTPARAASRSILIPAPPTIPNHRNE